MRKFIGTLFIIGVISNLQACDICGLSASSNYFGILPNTKWNFAGVRYQYRSYHTEHASILNESGKVLSDEFYSTTQFWGRYSPIKRIQLFAFVPYNIYNQRKDGVKNTLNGIGDISLMANYVLLNKADNNTGNWKHLLQVGAGVKFPTGKSGISKNDQEIDPDFQSGTGSFDFPFTGTYIISYKKWGINTELGYSLNLENDQSYKYGNRLSTSMNLFYQGNLKSVSLIPSIGLSNEQMEHDKKNSIAYPFTGGNALYLNTGIEIAFKRFSLGALIQQPLSQNIGDGKIKSNSRYSSSLIYLF